MKNALLVLAGVVAGMIAIFGMEVLAHAIYPPPANIDFNDPEQIRAYIKIAPAGSIAMVLLAYVVGGLVCGITVKLLRRNDSLKYAFTASTILTCFGVMNIMMIPHPLWFNIGTLFAFIPFAVLGHRVVRG